MWGSGGGYLAGISPQGINDVLFVVWSMWLRPFLARGTYRELDM
jgi:hypothetical protein